MNPLYLFGREMTPLRKLLLMKAVAGGAPLNEYTATGNPLSFNTNVSKPLKSLVIPWTPTQSGTGDPSPQNIRPISGVSALNVWQGTTEYPVTPIPGTTTLDGGTFTISNDGLITVSGTPTAGITGIVGYVNVKGDEVLYATIGGNFKNVLLNKPTCYDENGNTITTTFPDNILDAGMDLSLVPGVKKIRINLKRGANNVEMSGQGFIVVGAGSKPVLESYNVVFPATGKNLCGNEIEQGAIQGNSGQDSSATNRVRTKGYIPLSAGTYIISATGVGQAYIYVYGTDETYKKTESSSGFSNLPRTFTLTADRLVRIAFRINSSGSNVSPSDVSNVMLNEGSTALPYEPYTNTVYGGSLNLTTGVLTANIVTTHIDGNSILGFDGPYGVSTIRYRAYTSSLSPAPRIVSSYGNALADKFKYESNSYPNINCVSINNNKSVLVGVPGEITSKNDAISWLNDMGGFNVVYELAEPITYQLTPQEITSLIGTNVLWSDTNGSNTVVYLKKG